MAELRGLHDSLRSLVEAWDARLEGASPRQALGLLESLPRVETLPRDETLPRSAARRAGAAVSARRFSRAPGARRKKNQEDA